MRKPSFRMARLVLGQNGPAIKPSSSLVGISNEKRAESVTGLDLLRAKKLIFLLLLSSSALGHTSRTCVVASVVRNVFSLRLTSSRLNQVGLKTLLYDIGERKLVFGPKNLALRSATRAVWSDQITTFRGWTTQPKQTQTKIMVIKETVCYGIAGERASFLREAVVQRPQLKARMCV